MSVRLLHFGDLENAYDDPVNIGSFAGMIDHLDFDDAIVVGAGDNVAPGAFSVLSEGRHALDLFEAIDPDVDTLGNHDFDHGTEALRSVVADAPQTYVCANVYEDESRAERFAADAGLEPWTVVERADTRVGFFGVAHPQTPEITQGLPDVVFTDPIEAAEEAVAALESEAVDHVVGVSHLGDDDPIAEAVDVDAVLGAHIHDTRIEEVSGALLTRTSGYGREIVEVTVESDGDASGVRYDVTTSALEDPDVTRAYEQRAEEADLNEVVATLEDPVERVAYAGESAIGNFVADAYRSAGESDVGLVHSGGIREGPPLHGEVTALDLLGVVPFSGDLVTVELTGSALREAMGYTAGSHLELPDPTLWFAQVSGVALTYDHATDQLTDLSVDGDPVESDRRYTVTLPEYLVQTDALFPTIGTDRVVERVCAQYVAVLAYGRDHGITAAVEGRITRENVETLTE